MDDRFHIRQHDPKILTRESKRAKLLVQRAVGDSEVLEVGSTAVEGLIGKGDVDLLVRVPETQFKRTREALDVVFVRNPLQLSNEQYQGYIVDSPLDISVQLTVLDGPYDNFERFLEALRADPALLSTYNALKRAWDGEPMEKYRAAKSAFIRRVLERV